MATTYLTTSWAATIRTAGAPDPFVDVWPEVEVLLRQDGGLQAKTIWTELNERYAGRFSAGQLRKLQRRSTNRCR